MEQPPPLTPEQLAAAQASNQPEIGEPQTVKIFGILHLVFGAYGIFTILSGLVVIFFGNVFMDMLPQSAEMSAQAQAQAEMNDKLMPLNIISTILTIVVTALIITAGVTLLKKRRSGLKWSNRYAIASIFMKLVVAILTITITLPAMKEMMQSQVPAGASTGALGAMEIGMIGGALIGVLLPVIYPALTLVLLNRPATKDWFSNRPE